MNKVKKPTLVQFKKFLGKECWSEKEYGDLLYDKPIYDWWTRTIDKLNEKA